MDINLFDFYLPEELIAQKPSDKRDHSRLLAINKDTKTYENMTNTSQNSTKNNKKGDSGRKEKEQPAPNPFKEKELNDFLYRHRPQETQERGTSVTEDMRDNKFGPEYHEAATNDRTVINGKPYSSTQESNKKSGKNGKK